MYPRQKKTMFTRVLEAFVAISVLLLIAVLVFGIYISKDGHQFQKRGSRSKILMPIDMK
jgi:hypothetical protein